MIEALPAPALLRCAALLAATLALACGASDEPVPPAQAPSPPALEPEPSPSESGDAATEAAEAARAAWEDLRRLYERARASGESTSDDVMKWTAEDIARIGAWEYRVESLGTSDPEALAEALNGWGKERWEVFWMEREGDAYRLFLKRSARSYLRNVPVGELLRMLPNGASQ